MTKADRKEFDERLAKCDHWQRLSIETCLGYGLTSKAKELAKWREKDAAQ